MAAATSTLLALAAVGGYGIYKKMTSEDPRWTAAEANTKKQKEADKLLAEAKERERIDGVEADRDVKRARQRQNQLSAASSNKGGTMITKPAPMANASSSILSTSNQLGSSDKKTILGA